MTGGQCVSYGCCGSKWLNWHSVLTTQCWEHQTQSRRSRDDTQLSQSAYRPHESTANRDIYTTHQTSLLSGTKYKHMHRYITCGCGSVDTPISTMRYVMYFLLLCMMSFFSHNEANGPKSKTTRIFRPVRQVAPLGQSCCQWLQACFYLHE